jgi:hypothetical protein
MLRSFIFIFPVCLSSWLQYNSWFDGLRVGVWGEVSKKFGCKSEDDKGDELIDNSTVQVGSGGKPRIITDDSETFWLDNVKSELLEEHVGLQTGAALEWIE